MRIVGRLLACAALASACNDINASAPGANPPVPKPGQRLFASEESMLHLRTPKPYGTLLLAYSDERGFYIDDAVTNTLVQRPLIGTKGQWQGLTFAGLSISTDRGDSWTRIGPLNSASPDCGDAYCATVLLGDPWLAAGFGLTSAPTVLYTELAAATLPGVVPTGNEKPNAIAYFRSDGSDNFTFAAPPRVAVVAPLNGELDKESASLSGATAAIAYRVVDPSVSSTRRQLGIVVSDDSAQSWHAPVTVSPLPGDADANGITKFDVHNPIIKLITPFDGYVAYMLEEACTIYGVRVARLHRTTDVTGDHWQLTEAFRIDGVEYGPAVTGANNLTWRDEVPVSFDVGGPGAFFGSPHLWVALRRTANVPSGSRSVIELHDCVDTSNSCLGMWAMPRTFEPPFNQFDGDQMQPQVAARAATDTAAVTWYQAIAPGSSLVTFSGAFTIDDGASFSPAFDLLFPSLPWTPCPDPRGQIVPSCTGQPPGHYFGDYTATAILPFTTATIGTGRLPWLVSAHADSRAGCIELDDLTFDQHVQTERWP